MLNATTKDDRAHAARSDERPNARPRLLALVPDPSSQHVQPGGVLAVSRATFGEELRAAFDLRIVDTTMRAFPVPNLRERLSGSARRSGAALGLIRSHRPEVALAFCGPGASFYEKTSLLLLAAQAGARTYVSPRSGHAAPWLARSAAARRWIALVGARLDGFLVQSEHWREIYGRAGVPEHKLHIWHNPVDTSLWAPIAAARAPRPEGRPFRFLFMAWAIEKKGLRELVAAAARLAARPGPAFELAVAGDGAVGQELRERQARGLLPRQVELLGWVTGAARADELARADALVLPTHVEGFPNVVVEAMSCGLPVIATPAGAITDIVAHGETGLLVPIGDEDALLCAMDALRRDPARAAEMGRRGLERARTRFDKAIAIAKLIDVLRSGLRGDPSHEPSRA